MTGSPPSELRVLAIDPVEDRMGFVLLEGDERLVDWGITAIGRSGDLGERMVRFLHLIDRYLPNVLVLEDWRRRECRRCRRLRRLLRDAARLAEGRGLETFAVRQTDVHTFFTGLNPNTKETRARAIVTHFPELRVWLPPHRKPWMREDRRLAIFDAAAFGLAYLHREAVTHCRQDLMLPSSRQQL
jgi:hypothetical protein